MATSCKIIACNLLVLLVFVCTTGAQVPDGLVFSRQWQQPADATRADFNLDPAGTHIDAGDLLLLLEGTPLPTPTPPFEIVTADTTIGEGTLPDLAADEGNDFLLALERDDQVRVYELTLSAAAIGKSERFRQNDAHAPQVVADRNGFIILGYRGREDINLHSDLVLYFYDRSTTQVAASGRTGSLGLAIDPNGEGLLAWELETEDFYDEVLRYRTFDDDTALTGAIADLQPDKTDNLATPVLAANRHAALLAVWVEDNEDDIAGRFGEFSGSTFTSGSDFRLDTTGSGDRNQPALAPLDAGEDDGAFVVVWRDERDDSRGDVYARVVHQSGTGHNFDTAEFRVDAGGDAQVRSPAVAVLAGDRLLFAWADDREGMFHVYGALYDNHGTRLTDDQRLDSAAGGEGSADRVTLAQGRDGDGKPTGKAVLAWTENGDVIVNAIRLR